MCHDNVIIEYDRRRSVLPSAPVDMEYLDNSKEQYSSEHINQSSYVPTVLVEIALAVVSFAIVEGTCCCHAASPAPASPLFSEHWFRLVHRSTEPASTTSHVAFRSLG